MAPKADIIPFRNTSSLYLKDSISENRVVIIGDAIISRSVFDEAFSWLGCRHYYMEDGSSVLKHLDPLDLPDLILINTPAPDTDGFELAKKVKMQEKMKHIPIVLAVNTLEKSSIAKGLESGADDFIVPGSQFEIGMKAYNLLRLKNCMGLLEDNKKLIEHQVIEKKEELMYSSLEIVRSLCKAIEYRDDHETSMHVARMGNMSYVLAREYGLGDDLAKLILHASPVHDIGKVAIPDHILLKQGKLSREEMLIMQKHTLIGYQILDGEVSSELQECAKHIALNHHEHWDGSGYPQGLRAEDIPIEACIVAIADVFDALTHIRPYSPPWPVEQALEEIIKQSGKHFDPDLVDIFKANFDEIVSIKNKFPNESI